MNSALASVLGLVFTGIALYGFYWVIRLAVRDGMLEADRRRSRPTAPAPGPATANGPAVASGPEPVPGAGPAPTQPRSAD
jgi:hypothetical protein